MHYQVLVKDRDNCLVDSYGPFDSYSDGERCCQTLEENSMPRQILRRSVVAIETPTL